MAVDVEVGVDGRVSQHGFGGLHSRSAGPGDGHFFGEERVVESPVGERFEIHGLATVIVDERPGGNAVAEGRPVGRSDGIEAVGELAVDAIDPRAQLITLAGAGQMIEFQHKTREHPAASLRLHVGVTEIVRLGMKRRHAQNEIAECAPR